MRQSIVRNSALAWLAIVFLVTVLVPQACAQTTIARNASDLDLRAALLAPASSLGRLPGAANFRPNVTLKPRKMSHAQRRAWFLLATVQHGAAFFDARTTRDAMRHYQELDPLLRPFAHSAAIYPVMQIAPVGLDWLARRLATSRHKWLRRLWWVPQAAATAGFIWSGAHNLSLPASTGVPSTPGVQAP
jgi:hypothetical protein